MEATGANGHWAALPSSGSGPEAPVPHGSPSPGTGAPLSQWPEIAVRFTASTHRAPAPCSQGRGEATAGLCPPAPLWQGRCSSLWALSTQLCACGRLLGCLCWSVGICVSLAPSVWGSIWHHHRAGLCALYSPVLLVDWRGTSLALNPGHGPISPRPPLKSHLPQELENSYLKCLHTCWHLVYVCMWVCAHVHVCIGTGTCECARM